MFEKRGTAKYVVGVVSGGHFFSHLYLLAYPPLFPLLQEQFSLTTAQLGIIVSFVYIPQLFLQIPFGALADRVGAKPVFVGGITVTAAGTIFAGLAGAYWQILVAVLIAGVGQSTFHPADFALLSAVTAPGNEGKSFSFHTFSGYAGFAVAPVVVGGVALTVNWNVALLAIGAAGIAYALFAQLMMDSVHRNQLTPTSRGIWVDFSPLDSLAILMRPDIIIVFLIYLISMLGIVGLQSFTPIFIVNGLGLSEAVGNSALTAYLVLTAVGVLLGGPLADRFEFPFVLAATLVVAAVITWMTLVDIVHLTPYVTVALFAGIGLFNGAALPSRDKFPDLVSSDESTGKSFGFAYTGLSLGGIVGPAVLGATIDALTVTAAFAIIGVCFLGAAAVGILIRESSVSESSSRDDRAV